MIVGISFQFLNILTYGLWEIDIDILGAFIFIIGLIITIIGFITKWRLKRSKKFNNKRTLK